MILSRMGGWRFKARSKVEFYLYEFIGLSCLHGLLSFYIARDVLSKKPKFSLFTYLQICRLNYMFRSFSGLRF